MKTSVKLLVLIRFVCFSNAYDPSEYLDNDIPPNHRSFENDYDTGLGVLPEPSDQPPSEPLLPGHTLLRPTLGSLKSAVKFPQKYDDGYEGDRVRYSDFRRAPPRYMVESNRNNGLEKLLSKIWAPKTKGNTPFYYAQPLDSDVENGLQGVPSLEKSRYKVKSNRQTIENRNRLKNIMMLLSELVARTNTIKQLKVEMSDSGEEYPDVLA
ncbi:hypothetical protein JYU34_011119 [Plutella xylostella]|uniref:Uncharacterized protein n=1 Tax=Plutella xylostella TaxID=51655 RepID=A0ABQ7QG49_PLUXY|nr:hypothetical protein JYU34_011119 [Plutella xylostella]